jgi:hypothetical protein
MIRNFNRQLKVRFASRVTIKYDTAKPNETNSDWTTGITYCYNDVPCLTQVIGDVYFNDTSIANVITGKSNFFIYYKNYDFNYQIKRNIRIYDPITNRETKIDKAVPIVPLGNGDFLAWMLIQK